MHAHILCMSHISLSRSPTPCRATSTEVSPTDISSAEESSYITLKFQATYLVRFTLKPNFRLIIYCRKLRCALPH